MNNADNSKKTEFDPDAIDVRSISAKEYDTLTPEEQKKFEHPMPIKQARELFEGKERWFKREKQVFHNVLDIPEADWLVEAVIPVQGISLLYGDAGIGKTTLMLQLIDAVQRTVDFIGLSTKPSKVLLIEQDEPTNLIRSHVERMLPDCPSLTDLKVPASFLSWEDKTKDFEVGGGIPRDAASSLEELIFLSDSKIVVIDSLTSIGIADINNPGVSLLFDRLRRVSATYGCSFVLLHHPGKSREIMGSNLIKAKVDVILHLNKDRLTFQKLRGTTPKIAKFEPGKQPYLSIKQDPNTITFQLADTSVRNLVDYSPVRSIPYNKQGRSDRSEFIRKLWLDGKKRAEIVDLTVAAFQGNKETVGKAVDRERNKLEAEGLIKP